MYTVRNTGTLTVSYVVAPSVRAPWLPQVGMSLETTGVNNLRWLGLGPMESTRMRRRRRFWGVWKGRMDSPDMKWCAYGAVGGADVAGPDRARGLRVEGAPYLQVGPNRVDVLSAVVGRGEKNRRPSDPDERLDTTPNKEFAGEFTLSLLP